MNGSKALIDIAVSSKNNIARDMAVSKICEQKGVTALEYIAKTSEFKNTRRYVTLCLFQMEASSALKRLLENGPKDVKNHVEVLLIDNYESGGCKDEKRNSKKDK